MLVNTNNEINTKIETLFFRVFRKTVNAFYGILKLRPGSYPYITGDSFRLLANHIFDETQSFKPENVSDRDVVFVGMSRIREFLTEIHPKIINRYILIEHNGDGAIDESIASLIDEKIIRFYAQCVTVAHEKIVPIPIGIENKHHGTEVFPDLMKLALFRTLNKKPRIFFHFSVQTNPKERGPALEYFKKHPLMDTINKFIPYFSYKKLLASYCFTVSPAGNTLGSHRTWEALYLKTIPIVKRTVDAEYCVKMGLPIWIVDEWNELDNLSESDLETKYKEMISQASFEPLYMNYWTNSIKQALQRF